MDNDFRHLHVNDATQRVSHSFDTNLCNNQIVLFELWNALWRVYSSAEIEDGRLIDG